MNKAIILAAGRGRRLKKYHNKPKCLLKFGKQKISIIERLYDILNKKKFSDIVVVTGYKNNQIKNILGNQVRYINFRNYKNTNNLQSLLFAKNEMREGFLCFFSDLIFDETIIDKIIKKKDDFCLVVDTKRILKGTMRFKKYKNQITDMGNHLSVTNGDGNFIGISKFSNRGALVLKKYLIEERKNRKDYYTIVFKKMYNDGKKIDFFDCKKYFWKEIDTYKDLCDMQKIIKKGTFKY